MRTTLAHFLQRARQGVRTASGQVLTPPFRPIRDCVSVRRKRVLSLSVFYDNNNISNANKNNSSSSSNSKQPSTDSRFSPRVRPFTFYSVL